MPCQPLLPDPALPCPAVVLIGDAAHAVFPLTGNGMNSALQDGAMLGEVGWGRGWGRGEGAGVRLGVVWSAWRPVASCLHSATWQAGAALPGKAPGMMRQHRAR